jgi:hypothetical protein
MNACLRYQSLRQNLIQESNSLYQVKKNPVNLESLNFQSGNHLTSNQAII